MLVFLAMSFVFWQVDDMVYGDVVSWLEGDREGFQESRRYQIGFFSVMI